MRQLVFLEKGRLEWQEVSAPCLLAPTDALVRPLAVSRCDLDLGILYGKAPFPGPGPFPFGHEFVAEIIAVGEKVTEFVLGQRVVVPFQISCGTCSCCRLGLTGQCRVSGQQAMYGLGRDSQRWGGAFADVVLVPFASHMLVPLPVGIEPAAVASASDNWVDAWRAVAPYLAEQPKAPVLILGGEATSIGIYAAALAVALGSARVDYIDSRRNCLELAARTGANLLESLPGSMRSNYPITVNASIDANKLRLALAHTEPGGVCTNIGIYPEEVSLPLLPMYFQGIRLVNSIVNSRHDLPEVLEVIAKPGFQPEKYTTLAASWEEAPEALLERTIKVVICREGRNQEA